MRFKGCFVLAGALAFVDCVEQTTSRPSQAEVAARCAGISEVQTRTLMDELRDDVDRIEVVRERSQKPAVEHDVGVELHVRARAGMTAQWLSRLLTCHTLRDASGAPCTSAECPLAAPNLETDVTPTPRGFSIIVRAPESRVREVERRAHVTLDLRPPAGH